MDRYIDGYRYGGGGWVGSKYQVVYDGDEWKQKG